MKRFGREDLRYEREGEGEGGGEVVIQPRPRAHAMPAYARVSKQGTAVFVPDAMPCYAGENERNKKKKGEKKTFSLDAHSPSILHDDVDPDDNHVVK